MEHDYLEPIPEFPGACYIHIPVSKSRFRSTHNVGVTGADSLLWIETDCQTAETSCEVYYDHAVSDLIALPVPCRITIPNGKFHLILAVARGESNKVYTTSPHFPLVPTRGIVVPPNVAFGLQPLVGNRTTYLLKHHIFDGEPKVAFAYDHPAIAHHWLQLEGKSLSELYDDPNFYA